MRTKTFMMMVAAALVMAGCSNDNESDNWAGEIRLSSGLTVQQTDTRAATDIQSSQFANKEKIDVFISENVTTGTATTTYEQPLVYTADGSGNMSAPDNKQPYFPSSGNGVNIYAYYPSGTVSSIASDATDITFSVQTNQSGDMGDANYKASDLMYGKPSTNPVARTSSQIALNFTHLLSKVIITLESGAGSPSLDGAVVRLKSVKPSIALTPSTGAISTANGTATDITVMTASSSSLSGSAIVVPQTFLTSFIEITLANGGVLTSKDLKDSSGNSITSVVLTSGYVYTYTIKVNMTDLKVTSSISGWECINTNKTTGDAGMSDATN